MSLAKKFSKTDEVAGRIYNPREILEPEVLKEIYNTFRNEVPPIFGDNLVFGFLFGGFAKGYAVKDQDVDCYICLKEENIKQVAKFREWYFNLHAHYNFAPDVEIPGSISTWDHLNEKIDFAVRTSLRPVIETSYEKQCIVWGDIMSGEKAAKIGDLSKLNEIEIACEGLTQRWRIELLRILGEKADLEASKLPITRLFRKVITYQKVGDSNVPPLSLHN